MKRAFLFALLAPALLAACGSPEEESTVNKHARMENELIAAERALNARVENELAATERRLENEASEALNSLNAAAAEAGNSVAQAANAQ